MHTAGDIFVHGTSTNEEIDICAIEESICETRSISQEASPENIFKSITNPEIRQLFAGETRNAKPSNGKVYDIESIPKKSDYYNDDFNLITYSYSRILEGMINGSVKEFVKHVYAIFIVYRSHVAGGLAFHRALLVWLLRFNISKSRYGYIYLVTIARVRSLQKLKAISEEYFEIFKDDVSAIGRVENMDSLPDFISGDIERSINFNKNQCSLVYVFFKIANRNYW
ncbi:hypothetical protein CEXT_596131 [Caerostris extrusa]|uniref:Uncharacterized protein n=1 Tax=Caerostris extrusa TaxID=172846 RepID=A0AAV4SJR8_CAEEX|nr:hypothetical protein CEXT_596131 [Caerostris extrusa]